MLCRSCGEQLFGREDEDDDGEGDGGGVEEVDGVEGGEVSHWWKDGWQMDRQTDRHTHRQAERAKHTVGRTMQNKIIIGLDVDQ